MTTLDLPDPLGPMMVRSHPLPVEVCSGPNSHSTSLTNSSTRRSRPKKSPRVVLREGPQPFVWIARFSQFILCRMGRTYQGQDGPALTYISRNRLYGCLICCLVGINPDGLPPSKLLQRREFVVSYPHQDQPTRVQVGQAQVFS